MAQALGSALIPEDKRALEAGKAAAEIQGEQARLMGMPASMGNTPVHTRPPSPSNPRAEPPAPQRPALAAPLLP